jgi:hypothetical protein
MKNITPEKPITEKPKDLFTQDELKQPKNGKYLKIKVLFPDGSQVCHDNVTDTYVETLKRIGLERIKSLDWVKHGVNFIDDKKHPAYNQRFIEPNYYLFANLSTLDKLKIIKELAGQFNIHLKIEEFYK